MAGDPVLMAVIGDLLPFALGVALSPFPIVAVIAVLDSPGGRSRGAAFATGWVAGLLALSLVVVAIGSGLTDGDPSTGVSWLRLAVGVLLLALAVGKWRSRPGPGSEPKAPGWMAAIDAYGTGRTFLLGVGLAGANPKNAALTLAAAAGITESGTSGEAAAVAIAVFVVLASVSVLASVGFSLVAPARAAAPLARVKEFMARNNAVIMMVVLLLLGVNLIGKAMAGLAA